MRHPVKNAALVLAASIALTLAATPSQALSEALAKQCRALMVKAHPTVLYGTTGTAAKQRGYFLECVSRQGKMPDAQGGTTGSGSAGTTGQGTR